MDKQLVLNVVYGNKTYIIEINNETSYQDFLSKIFLKITNIIKPDNEYLEIFQENILTKFSDNFTLTWITKHINEVSWGDIQSMLESDDTIFINNRLKGGFFSAILIILAIFAILAPLLKPVRKMFEVIIIIFGLVGKFIELLVNVFEIIPLIFDPPKLIDDVLYAITTSLTLIFKRFSGDITNLASSPEDDTRETGPFGVSNANRAAFSCMDPTWSMLLLLIICPPLAIIYKLGFMAGFISSIICGVLCVKLYYFPGLLFAILHVLC
jgi:hypothetical protein